MVNGNESILLLLFKFLIILFIKILKNVILNAIFISKQELKLTERTICSFHSIFYKINRKGVIFVLQKLDHIAYIYRYLESYT